MAGELSDDYGLECSLYEHDVEGEGWMHTLPPMSGYYVPVTQDLTFYQGSRSLEVKMPWLDSYTYPVSFSSPRAQHVVFVCIRPGEV